MTLSLLLTGSVILLSLLISKACAIRRCHPCFYSLPWACSLAKTGSSTFPSMITKPLTSSAAVPLSSSCSMEALGQAQSGTPRSQGVGPFIDGRRCPFCLGACRTRPFHPRPGGCGKVSLLGPSFPLQTPHRSFPSFAAAVFPSNTTQTPFWKLSQDRTIPWPSC